MISLSVDESNWSLFHHFLHIHTQTVSSQRSIPGHQCKMYRFCAESAAHSHQLVSVTQTVNISSTTPGNWEERRSIKCEMWRCWQSALHCCVPHLRFRSLSLWQYNCPCILLKKINLKSALYLSAKLSIKFKHHHPVL